MNHIKIMLCGHFIGIDKLERQKLLSKSGLNSITIDIDSSVINVEVHQNGATKGCNPKKVGNHC